MASTPAIRGESRRSASSSPPNGRGEPMRPRVIAAILVTVVAAAVMTLATGATFSIATSNAGDGFSAGTVYLDDNDGGAALFSFSSVRPGANTTACVQV